MSLQYKFLNYYNSVRYFLKNKNIPFDAAGTHLLADTSKQKHVQDFQTIVGLILTSQTRNQIVEKAMKNLKFSNNFDAYHLSKQSESETVKLLEGVTYPMKKAKHIRETAKLVLSEFNGLIPTDPKQIKKLKGIGKKSTELFLKKIENQEGKHINLTSKTLLFLLRVQMIAGQDINIYKDEEQLKNPQIQEYLQSFIDPILWKTLHIPLDIFVDEVCQDQKPKCQECPLRDRCPTFLLTQQGNKPIQNPEQQ